MDSLQPQNTPIVYQVTIIPSIADYVRQILIPNSTINIKQNESTDSEDYHQEDYYEDNQENEENINSGECNHNEEKQEESLSVSYSKHF